MREYLELLIGYAAERTNDIFYTGDAEHITYVLSGAFRYTDGDIRLLCSPTDPEMDIDMIQRYLGQKNLPKLFILFDVEPSNELVRQFRNIDDGFIEVRVLTTPHRHIQYEDRVIHFNVFGETGYRMETAPERFLSYGSFNDTEKVKVFTQAFDKFFTDEYSQKIM